MLSAEMEAIIKSLSGYVTLLSLFVTLPTLFFLLLERLTKGK